MKTPYPPEFLELIGRYGVAGVLEMLAWQVEQASDVWADLNKPSKAAAWKEISAALDQLKERARTIEVSRP